METRDLIKMLEEKRNELRGQMDVIEKTIGVLRGGFSPAGNPQISTAAYRKEGTLRDKILFSLNSISRGTVRDIVGEIKKHESIRNEGKFLRAVTMVASALKSKGILRAEKEGIRNIYYKEKIE